MVVIKIGGDVLAPPHVDVVATGRSFCVPAGGRAQGAIVAPDEVVLTLKEPGSVGSLMTP